MALDIDDTKCSILTTAPTDLTAPTGLRVKAKPRYHAKTL